MHRFTPHYTPFHKQLLKRTLWTRVTATGRTIHECLQNSDRHLPKRANVCVALVSKSHHDYQGMLQHLNDRLQPEWLLGCVVDHVPAGKHGVSLLVGDDQEHVVGFHVPDSPGRHKVRSIAVGRWGRPEDFDRLKFQGNKLNESGWGAFDSISRPAEDIDLPPALKQRDGSPSFVFLASDNEPDQLLHTLDHHFPDATKFGVVGASTPFVTGKPYTLFYKGEPLLGAGIVGFASYKKAALHSRVAYNTLEPLGEPLRITRCRGNIILDLDQAGATGLLLALIQQGSSARIAKDQEFYLGIYPPGETNLDPQQMRVNRVTSGDPSRGNMSVDTTLDFQEGQIVQFMKRQASSDNDVLSNTQDGDITLGVVDKDHTVDASPIEWPSDTKTVVGVFGGATENGVILGHSKLPTQVSDVPSSTVHISGL